MKRKVAALLLAVLLIGMITIVPRGQASAATSKLVAITFDDGPGAYTERLLDGLKARGAKATFFMVGNLIGNRMDTVKRMVREGHQIGNHTYSHPNLNTLSSASVRSELNRTRNLLAQAGGNQTYALRPPYGNHNATVRTAAGGPIILWSVDTLDWKTRNADAVYNSIIRNTRDGSIVLLHDIYSTSVSGALRAIDTLKAKGYEFVTVNELFRRRAVKLENGKVYSCAYNKGITLPAVQPPVAPTCAVEAVYGGQKISLKCATADSKIYYTLDGSTPSEKSAKYTAPLILQKNVKLRAIAYNAGGKSGVLQKNITLYKCPAPTISLKQGKAHLTPAAGTILYYTVNGSAPTAGSAKYTAPVAVNNRLNVLVRAPGKLDRQIQYSFTKYGAILTDTPADAWYFSAVGEAMHSGLLVGMGDMSFAPETPMTRAMFVTALYRMTPNADGSGKCTFTDVPAKSWYAVAVRWAQRSGIVSGMTPETFAPDREITREQMCAILNRYLDVYSLQLKSIRETTFADDAEISRWAKADVYALYEVGLINGMGHNTFAPKDKATRAQCARLLVTLDNAVTALEEETL